MSLALDQHYTQYTTTHNEIFIGEHQKQRAIFLKKYHYKELTNDSQFNHIIHDIVVNKGFMMNSESNGCIKFTHPQNNSEDTTEYTIWPKTREVEKYTTKFLHFV